MIDMELFKMIENSAKNELSLNDNNYVVYANEIIQGRQSMSMQCARLIRLVVMQVVKDDKDLKTYTCRIQDLANFLDITSEHMYRDIQKICEECMKSIVYIKDNDNDWAMLHWISYAKYRSGVLTIRLSDEIKPYVLELNSFFTRYKLHNILEFTSFYAIRLYELLIWKFNLDKKSDIVFSVQELREYFDCLKKYSLTADFIKRAVDIAVKEINESSDITVSQSLVRTGRQITAIKFTVSKKTSCSASGVVLPERSSTPVPVGSGSSAIDGLMSVTKYEFTYEDMQIVYDLVKSFIFSDSAIILYVQQKYARFLHYAKKNKVKNRFEYFLQMLSASVASVADDSSKRKDARKDAYKNNPDFQLCKKISVIDEID